MKKTGETMFMMTSQKSSHFSEMTRFELDLTEKLT